MFRMGCHVYLLTLVTSKTNSLPWLLNYVWNCKHNFKTTRKAETWLAGYIPSSCILQDTVILRNDRNTHGGGVLLAISPNCNQFTFCRRSISRKLTPNLSGLQLLLIQKVGSVGFSNALAGRTWYHLIVSKKPYIAYTQNAMLEHCSWEISIQINYCNQILILKS